VQLQEAESQIITHYEVYEEPPSDQRLLVPAAEAHCKKLGRVPRLVVADAGYYSGANEDAGEAMGVDYLSIPNRNTRSDERRKCKRVDGSRMARSGVSDARAGREPYKGFAAAAHSGRESTARNQSKYRRCRNG
jgi:Transposase DDE domain